VTSGASAPTLLVSPGQGASGTVISLAGQHWPTAGPITSPWIASASGSYRPSGSCGSQRRRVHTFIRAPAAALLAWAALSGVQPEWRVIAALLCGGVALSAHGLKSSARVALNTSPEPVTNWVASFAEDGLTAFLLLLAVKYPLAAALVAGGVVLLALLLVGWIGRTLRRFLAVRRAVTA
jgi:hypothetical protein